MRSHKFAYRSANGYHQAIQQLLVGPQFLHVRKGIASLQREAAGCRIWDLLPGTLSICCYECTLPLAREVFRTCKRETSYNHGPSEAFSQKWAGKWKSIKRGSGLEKIRHLLKYDIAICPHIQISREIPPLDQRVFCTYTCMEGRTSWSSLTHGNESEWCPRS